MRRVLGVGVLMIGCDGGGEPIEPGPACEQGVTVIWPLEGADLFGGGPIEVQLDNVDDEAGFVGDGAYTRDERVLGLWPTPPAEPASDVSFSLQTCAGTQSLSFRTTGSDVPLGADADLLNRSFILELGDATFLRPSSFGDLLGLVPDASTRLIVGVVADDGDAVTLRIGIATEDNTQDLCSRTMDLQARRDRGYLVFDPAAVSFPISELTITLRSIRFVAAIAPDGSAVSDASVSIFADVQSMADVWAGGDPVQACSFFGGIGVDCAACPDDAAKSCLVLDAVQMGGPSVIGSLVSVTESCGPPEE